MALSLPEATERAHMQHPDFRVCGRIFATLGYPHDGWGMVSLNPKQQAMFVDAEPEAFIPVAGAWGRKGATNVNLRAVSKDLLRKALEAAWSNKAPKRLASRIEGQAG